MNTDVNRVKNGKAFEYALLTQYVKYLRDMGIKVSIAEDAVYKTVQSYFCEQPEPERLRFEESAKATIPTIVKLEPGLTAAKDDDDILLASLATDAEGQHGDVRDVVFKRIRSNWELGFSAKNNHEAVKHSRLSNQKDFGASWLGKPCSQQYWDDIRPIFDLLDNFKNQGYKWKDVPNKGKDIYLPLLKAFRDEMMRLSKGDSDVPPNLIRYLIGIHPFYKIIKDDRNNLVVVKAFNIDGKLNKKVNGKIPRYKTPKLNLPSRIVEFEIKPDSETTLIMILDEGWEVSFRIHNPDTDVKPSLKFDIQLLGNPPILFTQHLFQ